jgi:hypothetical protein
MNAESEMAGSDGLGGPPKEHEVVFGLTDYEVSVLRGALIERGEKWSADLETCKGLLSIVDDQLGPEDDDGGWDVLKGEELEGNARRAMFGKRAVDAGTPDRGDDGDRTDAIDTVGNVLHFLASAGEDEPAGMLSSAAAHFYAETEGDEE